MAIKDGLRWWFYKMGLIKGDKINVPQGIEAIYEDIKTWQNIYSGSPPWLSVHAPTIANGGAKRDIAQLKMAKVLASELTTLIFNEKVTINVSSKTYPDISEYIDMVLKENSFYKNFKQTIENMFAIGGASAKVYYDNGIKIDFVNANQFMPLKWNNRILSAVFASREYSEGHYYTLYETHKILNKGEYEIENRVFKSNSPNDIGVEIFEFSNIFENLNPITPIETNFPLFIYFSPATNNNIYPEFPLGISIFANATDTLKLLDVAFDSFMSEFELGQKRIIVPATAVDVVYDNEGMPHRYFNANSRVFVAMEMDECEKIIDDSVELRVEEHISAINAMLDILCMQCGLSSGTFSFDGKSVKTATEVISENSKTFRTKQDNENDINDGICQMIDAIITVAQLYGEVPKNIDYECTVSFDDSIVIDKNADLDNGIKEIQAGIKSKLKFMMTHYKYTEQQAKEELKRIAEEQQINGENIDFFGGE